MTKTENVYQKIRIAVPPDLISYVESALKKARVSDRFSVVNILHTRDAAYKINRLPGTEVLAYSLTEYTLSAPYKVVSKILKAALRQQKSIGPRRPNRHWIYNGLVNTWNGET